MTEFCVCCSEAQAEYMFSWEEPSEHRKDQLALMMKVLGPYAVVTFGIAAINYYLWKKKG